MGTHSFEEELISRSMMRPYNIEGLRLFEPVRFVPRRKDFELDKIFDEILEIPDFKLTTQADWAAYSESSFQKYRGVLYGDLYDEESLPEGDIVGPLESFGRSQRRLFFNSLGTVGELKDFMFNMKQVLHFVESRSTSAEFLNFSVSEEFRSSLLDAMKSRDWDLVESMVMPVAAALPRRAAIYDAFIVLASLLLSAIFQYLMALLDKGGTRIHSSDSREFRSRYISIVLFQGAYVWIKFREVAPESQQKPLRGLYRRCKINDLGVKVYYGNYEPRFKPLGSGSYISVGSYEEEEDAKIIYQILAFYYGREVPGELPLLNGSTYRIPCMTEEEQRLDPESKKEWAKGKAKVVFEEFKGALMKSFLCGCPSDSPEVQVTGDISNNLPPDAGARVQLGNQSGDGLDVPLSPNNSSPDVGPGIPVHVADDSFNDHAAAAAGAGVSDEPPLEPHYQHHASEENQANNVNPDYFGVLRLVKELQRQQQLQQFLIQQQESRIQQQESRIQQQETRISGLERHQQLQELHMQQQESRIAEMESEAEFRNTEPARKRICVGVSLRHDP